MSLSFLSYSLTASFSLSITLSQLSMNTTAHRPPIQWSFHLRQAGILIVEERKALKRLRNNRQTKYKSIKGFQDN